MPLGSDGLPLPRPDNTGFGFQDEELGRAIDCCAHRRRKSQRRGRGKPFTTAYVRWERCTKCGNHYPEGGKCLHRKTRTIRDRHEQVETERQKMIEAAAERKKLWRMRRG